MKISLIVERDQVEDTDAFIPQVTRLLIGWGVNVKQIIPEHGCLNLAHIQLASDLYLLTSCTPLALSLAGMLDALGAALINPYPVANMLHNRLIGLRILQAHGLPIAESYVTANAEPIQALLEVGPLICQPQSSSQADAEQQSKRFVATLHNRRVAVEQQHPLIAQQSIEPMERDWMISCIGGQLFGIDHTQPVYPGFRKSFAPSPSAERWDKPFSTSYRDPVSTDIESPTPAELAELALRCGQALDIDLFGIKVVEHQGTLSVVDMVSFPDFREEPEAVPRLAEYLYARAQFVMEKHTKITVAGDMIVRAAHREQQAVLKPAQSLVSSSSATMTLTGYRAELLSRRIN